MAVRDYGEAHLKIMVKPNRISKIRSNLKLLHLSGFFG